jgi:hypothetical protein
MYLPALWASADQRVGVSRDPKDALWPSVMVNCGDAWSKYRGRTAQSATSARSSRWARAGLVTLTAPAQIHDSSTPYVLLLTNKCRYHAVTGRIEVRSDDLCNHSIAVPAPASRINHVYVEGR